MGWPVMDAHKIHREKWYLWNTAAKISDKKEKLLVQGSIREGKGF